MEVGIKEYDCECEGETVLVGLGAKNTGGLSAIWGIVAVVEVIFASHVLTFEV